MKFKIKYFSYFYYHPLSNSPISYDLKLIKYACKSRKFDDLITLTAFPEKYFKFRNWKNLQPKKRRIPKCFMRVIYHSQYQNVINDFYFFCMQDINTFF